MPASMMIAPAGFMLKVSGSSIAMVAGGPRPGRMPTTVPRNTTTKHHSRFVGASATEKPCSRPEAMSTLEAEHARWETEAERQVENEIEARRGSRGDGRGGPGRFAVHDRGDEVGQEREAQDEAQRAEQPDANGEREPHAERPPDPPPIERLCGSRCPAEV